MAQSSDIKTGKLLITPFSERHLTQRYVDWLNDPEVTRYSEQRHRKHTLEECRAYWRSYDSTPHYFWAVELLDTHEHIGNSNAYVDVNNKTANVGCLVGEKRLWNKGYGGEILSTVCNYLLYTANLRKVTCGTFATHLGVLHVLKKIGMFEECRIPKHYLWEGKEVDLVEMVMYNSSFKGNTGG
jgi:ribosomal-protein-alanine N-acetyltransferase